MRFAFSEVHLLPALLYRFLRARNRTKIRENNCSALTSESARTSFFGSAFTKAFHFPFFPLLSAILSFVFSRTHEADDVERLSKHSIFFHSLLRLTNSVDEGNIHAGQKHKLRKPTLIYDVFLEPECALPLKTVRTLFDFLFRLSSFST